MMRNLMMWILALLLTVASAYYQRKTGPTHPEAGQADLAGSLIQYKLLRSHDVGDQPVNLQAPDSAVEAVLVYRRLNSADDWTRKRMSRQGDALISSLPHQPPGGKLEYYLEVEKGQETLRIPADSHITTRFKGAVPAWALLPHILFMFAAMLLSTRTALAALTGSQRLRAYVWWTVGLLILGGMIFGPLVQEYAFGDLWTGFPFGYDLTDNKTLIALVSWLWALWAMYKSPHPKRWILIAAAVTLVVFIIPHSLLGTELDYRQTPAGR